MFRSRCSSAVCSLAPHLRGEGWGEGLFDPDTVGEEAPPHPNFELHSNFDLSPQAGER
jgi:hypothetical protein